MAPGGPTFCYRGLANDVYYILEQDRSRCADYSGCGNTLNANHPIVRRLIQDSLRYWVTEMHVDGFRFDLASILSRDECGEPLPNPPVLWDIESDPLLAGTKLIAEAWDAAGLYQVGTFVGDTWQEWNGRFRDDVRRFVKGDSGMVSRMASRLLGSPDIYGHEEREAEQSINFVTCHDGFTLNDLVSYNVKHNEANGENGRDGSNDNESWNCGTEGPTDDDAIEALRNRQIKNFLALLLLSSGTPMLLMGDEMRHSQRGNNNAYCQDNEVSWLDWTLLERHADVHRFVSALTAFRARRDVVAERTTLSLNQLLRRAEIAWHGVALNRPDWTDHSRSLALTVRSLGSRFLYHAIFNAYWEPLTFELPPAPNGEFWRRCIDTAPRLARRYPSLGRGTVRAAGGVSGAGPLRRPARARPAAPGRRAVACNGDPMTMNVLAGHSASSDSRSISTSFGLRTTHGRQTSAIAPSASSSAAAATADPRFAARSTRRTFAPSRRRSATTATTTASTVPSSSDATRTRCLSQPLRRPSRCSRSAVSASCSKPTADRRPRPRYRARFSRTTAVLPAASPTASSRRRRTIRPRTAASSTSRRPAGRPTPPSPAGLRRGRTVSCGPSAER